MAKREDEYLKRLRELGYEPSLAGMDDEDMEYHPLNCRSRSEVPRCKAAPLGGQ